jgi:hypothetical protein
VILGNLQFEFICYTGLHMDTQEKEKSHPLSHIRLWVLIGFIAGVVWIVGLRVLLFNPPVTHYHANFAVYIDGKKFEFEDPSYYEEVSSCSTTNTMEPKSRVHLHNQQGHLVHVHDDASTWGHLFANLGLTLGNTVLRTRDAVYLDGQNNKTLTFYLNGETVPTLANRVIESEDELIVSYGTASAEQLQNWRSDLPKDAAESNSKPDPSSCSGPDSYTFGERIKKALDITK